jgi:hypothetical protein
LGALPVGTASDGETYSLPSCEYATKPAIPINTNTQPNRFISNIDLPSRVPEFFANGLSLSLAAKGAFNSVDSQLNGFHAFPRTDVEAKNFIYKFKLYFSDPHCCGTKGVTEFTQENATPQKP